MGISLPEFGSFEEMQAFLDGAESSPTAKKKTSAKKKSEPKKVAPKKEDSVGDPKIWREEHFFLRPGFTWQQVKKDGEEAASFESPSNKVIIHHHISGEGCVKQCQTVE